MWNCSTVVHGQVKQYTIYYNCTVVGSWLQHTRVYTKWLAGLQWYGRIWSSHGTQRACPGFQDKYSVIVGSTCWLFVFCSVCGLCVLMRLELELCASIVVWDAPMHDYRKSNLLVNIGIFQRKKKKGMNSKLGVHASRTLRVWVS